MVRIGERLRQERLRRGLDLFKIAEQTKINAAFLEAIETGDIDKLPGAFFTRSFVRQYAQALDIANDEFEQELIRDAVPETEPVPQPPGAAHYEFQFAPVARPMRVSRRAPRRSQNLLPSLVYFILILAACSGAYLLWQQKREARPRVKASGQILARAKSAATPAPAPSRPTETPQPAAAIPASSPASAGQLAAAPAAATDADLPALSSVPEGQTAAVHLEIRAASQVWIRVIGDGRHIFSGIVEANQTRAFQAVHAIALRTGSAGSIAVTRNGQPVPPLGPEGQVRDALFTPEDWKILPPSPPAASAPEASPETEAR